jgi:hypothetical protein
MRNHLWASLAWLALGCLPHTAASGPPSTLPVIPVRVLTGTDPSILQDLVYVRRARGAEPVTLQLDLAHRRVLDGGGRVVAGPDGVRPAYLQSVVDKWRYVIALGAIARAHPQELRAGWEDGGSAPQAPQPWIAGTEAIFVVRHLAPERSLVMFGVGPNGHLYLLHTGKIPPDMEFVSPIAVPPLGAEHIVAVTAADPQGIHELAVWLGEGNEGGGPGLIDTQGEILKQIASLRDVRVGIVTAYSCTALAECAK